MSNFAAFSQRLADIKRRAQDPAVQRAVLVRVGEAWAEEANKRAPVGKTQPAATGTPPGRRLAGSIVFMPVSATRGYLVIPNPGRYVLYGTRPHIIQPRAGRRGPGGRPGMLRFVPQGGDAAVFARRVHHPGTRPNLFVEDAWRSGAVRDALRFAAVAVVRGAEGS